MRMHLTDRRSKVIGDRPKPAETAQMATHQYLLNAGFYMADYGLICLSTVNTKDEPTRSSKRRSPDYPAEAA